jgi:hypothetical protein
MFPNGDAAVVVDNLGIPARVFSAQWYLIYGKGRRSLNNITDTVLLLIRHCGYDVLCNRATFTMLRQGVSSVELLNCCSMSNAYT